jgi:hypothetical protein
MISIRRFIGSRWRRMTIRNTTVQLVYSGQWMCRRAASDQHRQYSHASLPRSRRIIVIAENQKMPKFHQYFGRIAPPRTGARLHAWFRRKINLPFLISGRQPLKTLTAFIDTGVCYIMPTSPHYASSLVRHRDKIYLIMNLHLFLIIKLTFYCTIRFISTALNNLNKPLLKIYYLIISNYVLYLI